MRKPGWGMQSPLYGHPLYTAEGVVTIIFLEEQQGLQMSC